MQCKIISNMENYKSQETTTPEIIHNEANIKLKIK